MRTLLTHALLLLILIFGVTAQASQTVAKNANQMKANKYGTKLGTNFQFNDLSVRGRYQTGFEGIATIENEKSLEDLLDYRTDYQDRLAKSKTQR